MVLYAGVTELADVLDLGSSVLAAWEFKSLRPHQKAICGSDSVVECDLAKVEVAGSNPVFRSTPFSVINMRAIVCKGKATSLKLLRV